MIAFVKLYLYILCVFVSLMLFATLFFWQTLQGPGDLDSPLLIWKFCIT